MSEYVGGGSSKGDGGSACFGAGPVVGYDSSLLDKLSICAPNWCSAVIVDGVGSRTLLIVSEKFKEEIKCKC